VFFAVKKQPKPQSAQSPPDGQEIQHKEYTEKKKIVLYHDCIVIKNK